MRQSVCSAEQAVPKHVYLTLQNQWQHFLIEDCLKITVSKFKKDIACVQWKCFRYMEARSRMLGAFNASLFVSTQVSDQTLMRYRAKGFDFVSILVLVALFECFQSEIKTLCLISPQT